MHASLPYGYEQKYYQIAIDHIKGQTRNSMPLSRGVHREVPLLLALDRRNCSSRWPLSFQFPCMTVTILFFSALFKVKIADAQQGYIYHVTETD